MAAAVARAGALTWAETGAGPHGETGLVRAEPAAWGDVVLGRKETPASYHLAVVLDDALQGVTQVVRGQDLFWSTSIHRLLQALLGLPSPRYHHHRLVLDAEGRKLAKSTGSTALRDLRAAGATPADIRAMIGVNQLTIGGMVPAPTIWHSVTRGRQGTDAEEAQVRSQEAAGAPRAAPAACVCRPRGRSLETALAELAHDVRTPLTGILALSELLAVSELPERERGWAKTIKSIAEHLTLLTSLIVDAVRSDAKGLVLRRELMRPRQLAEALGASLAARAEAKGLTAELALADDLPAAAMGDPAAAARGAGEHHRQRHQVHRARQRPLRGQERQGGARAGAAHLHGDRQRHRPQRRRHQAAVPPVRAGE